MVRCKSNTRFSNIKKSVILTQTDTTVGFVSQNHKKLADIKDRPVSKPFIVIYDSFYSSKYTTAAAPRIPQNHKNLVRRAKKTTFIVKDRAFRIDHTYKNSQVLRDLSWHYSTSANENSKKFDREFCENKADIIVEDKNSLRELSSSRLLKINNTKIKALR